MGTNGPRHEATWQRLVLQWLAVAAAVGCDEAHSAETMRDASSERARSADGAASSEDARVDQPSPTFEPTLVAIQREVFGPTCAAVFCHKDTQLGFDASSLEQSMTTLIDVPSDTLECGDSGLVRVLPGRPEESLLYLKLTDPPCGRKMPLLFNPMIDPRALEQIRAWIEIGAPLD